MFWCLIARLPFEAPECDSYDEYKYQLIDYGLRLLRLSNDASVISESNSQESIMSIVRTPCPI